MNRQLLTVIGVAALAFLALACTETTLLPPGQEAPGVTVSGSGSVFGAPDIALLSLGVEAQADSVGEARMQAAGAMDAMLAALKDGGVAEDDLQTTRFSVQPVYDFIEGRQELRGFLVSNIVTAKIRSIDDTGALIDGALEAGGDRARVESLQFTIDDPSALEEEARTKAMDEALRKAQTLAGAAGVELGAPRSIAESGGPVPIPFEVAAIAAEERAADTPIQTGELEVVVQVQVVYGLETD